VIEFEQACFSYGREAVLRDVTLTLSPGSFHVLVGPSGAGKTTLLRLCHLDLAPTSGAIRLFGRGFAPRDRNAVADLRRTIGVLPQRCEFLDHLPLVDNIALPLLVSGLDARTRAEDLEALLEWVDLTDRAEALPGELSDGERRRAALARAVILSPEVVLADEPTGGLDRDMAMRLLTLLVELNRMGKTVLVATHDPDLARAAEARVPVRVLRLARGAVEGTEP
jgi:cell division transport system ATP-binding protein